MRQNTVTYWTTADFANLETYGLMMPFGKLCCRRPEKIYKVNRPRKTTPTALADYKCNIVFYDTERIMGNDMWGTGEGRGRGRKDINSMKTHVSFFGGPILQLVRGFLY